MDSIKYKCTFWVCGTDWHLSVWAKWRLWIEIFVDCMAFYWTTEKLIVNFCKDLKRPQGEKPKVEAKISNVCNLSTYLWEIIKKKTI